MSGDPRSWLDKAVGAAVGLLIAALAIYSAVRLIESVLLALVVIVLIVCGIGAVVAILRARYRGW